MDISILFSLTDCDCAFRIAYTEKNYLMANIAVFFSSVGDPKCGGVVTASNGSLMGIDRDQDGQYDIYQDCLWTLKAPAGMQIEVQVHSVAIPYDHKCKIAAFSVNIF